MIIEKEKKAWQELEEEEKKEIHLENSKSITTNKTKGLTKKLPRGFVQRPNLNGKEKGLLINLWLQAKNYSSDIGEYGVVKTDYSILANYLGYKGLKKSRNRLQVKKVLDSLVKNEAYIQYEECTYCDYDLKITIQINEIDKNFVQVPYLLECLGAEFISVMVVLLSFMDGYNPSKPVYPSVDTICKYSGIGYRNKVIGILQAFNMLNLINYQEQEKGGGRKKTNKYYLADETGRMYYLNLEDTTMDPVKEHDEICISKPIKEKAI